MRLIVITPKKEGLYVYNEPYIQLKYNSSTKLNDMVVTNPNCIQDTYEKIPFDVAIEIASILKSGKDTLIIDFSKLMKKGDRQ